MKRLASLFLLGTVYASVVLVPALVVYWAVVDVSAAVVAGGIVLIVIVSVVVPCLSCLVGWAVAKASLRLKNKSFVTVLIALAFVGLYYFAYFQAEAVVKDMLVNAALYGTSVQDAVPWLFESSGVWKSRAFSIWRLNGPSFFKRLRNTENIGWPPLKKKDCEVGISP